MSRQHRAYIRHHIRDLIAGRRCMIATLPTGERVRGHKATRMDWPLGSLVSWFCENAKPGDLPHTVYVMVTPPVPGMGWAMRNVEPITAAHAL